MSLSQKRYYWNLCMANCHCLVPWRLSNGVSILVVRTVWPSKAFSELKKHDLISNFVNSDFFYFGFHLWIVSRMSLLVCDSCGWSYSVSFKSTWGVIWECTQKNKVTSLKMVDLHLFIYHLYIYIIYVTCTGRQRQWCLYTLNFFQIKDKVFANKIRNLRYFGINV